MNKKFISLSIFSLVFSTATLPALGMQGDPVTVGTMYTIKPVAPNIPSMNPDVITGPKYVDPVEAQYNALLTSNRLLCGMIGILGITCGYLAWNQYKMNKRMDALLASRGLQDIDQKITGARKVANEALTKAEEAGTKVDNLERLVQALPKDLFEKMNERFARYDTAYKTQWETQQAAWQSFHSAQTQAAKAYYNALDIRLKRIEAPRSSLASELKGFSHGH